MNFRSHTYESSEMIWIDVEEYKSRNRGLKGKKINEIVQTSKTNTKW